MAEIKNLPEDEFHDVFGGFAPVFHDELLKFGYTEEFILGPLTFHNPVGVQNKNRSRLEGA